MTLQRKIFIVVLLLALAVLIWDKGFNQQSVTEPQQTQAKTDTQALHDLVKQQLEPLAELQKLSNRQQFMQPESLPELEMPVPTPPPATMEENALTNLARNIFSATEKFQQAQQKQQLTPTELTVSAIIKVGSKGAYAQINDKVYSTGDRLGSYVVEQIDRDCVVLQDGYDKMTLYVEP